MFLSPYVNIYLLNAPCVALPVSCVYQVGLTMIVLVPNVKKAQEKYLYTERVYGYV